MLFSQKFIYIQQSIKQQEKIDKNFARKHDFKDTKFSVKI